MLAHFRLSAVRGHNRVNRVHQLFDVDVLRHVHGRTVGDAAHQEGRPPAVQSILRISRLPPNPLTRFNWFFFFFRTPAGADRHPGFRARRVRPPVPDADNQPAETAVSRGAGHHRVVVRRVRPFRVPEEEAVHAR